MEKLLGLGRRYHHFFVSLTLVGITVAVFGQVVGHDFVNYDDPLYVTDNFHVQAGLTFGSLHWAMTTFHTGNWHPLTWLSHMLDSQFYGLNPSGHHLTNLLLHVVNVLLLFAVLQRMTRAFWQSAVVAALFAVHPLHVESVAWIAERKDLLSAMFWLLTLGAYVRYIARPTLLAYLLVIVTFALGLMAKPMVITLPAVLLLLDYWPLGRMGFERLTVIAALRRGWPLIVEKLPLVVMASASGVVTYLAQQRGGAVRSLDVVPLGARIDNALVSYLCYIGKMLWPRDLAVFYPPLGVDVLVWPAIGAALFLAVVTGLVTWGGRRYPYLPVGWFWYLGTLVPVVGLVQLGSQAMADRYTYLPLIGLFLLIAWGMSELVAEWRNRRLALILTAGIVLPTLTVDAWVQAGYWRNSTTLFEHALHVTTDNYIAHNNLGAALAQQGRLQEAMAHYVEALRIKPDHAMLHSSVGNVYRAQGRLEEALEAYRTALQLQPTLAEAHNNLGIVYKRLGRLEEAMDEYQTALILQPELIEAHYNLGNAYLDHGQPDAAIQEYHAVLHLDPSHLDARNNLGSAYLQSGNAEAAMKELERVIRERPDAQVYYNLGVAYARQGDIQHAKEQFDRALQLRPDYEQARQAVRSLTR